MLDLLVRARVVFDGARELSDTAVGVTGDRVVWLGPSADAPAARTVLSDDGTLLPGLFDLHFHHFLLSPLAGAKDRDVSLDREPLVGAKVFKAAWAARTWLSAGVTTVRDAGAPEYLAVAMREAVAEGWTPGPRIYASGPLIAQTGGIRPGNESHVEEVTGADEARRVARRQLKAGVDVLKIYGASSLGGGGGRLIGPPGWPQLSEPEIRAIVEEGHKAGRLVSAHAISAESVKNAVRAGVDWIDHGSLIDDEAIDLLLEHDTPLVPTQALLWSMAEFGEMQGFGKHIPALAREMAGEARERLSKAWRAGVRMAAGTDADNPRASIAKECELFTQIGMSPLDALRAATSCAAAVLGVTDHSGSIDVGKEADLVIVAGNPLRDISDLARVRKVIQAGCVVSSDTESDPPSRDGENQGA